MARKDWTDPNTVKRGPGKAAHRQQDIKVTKVQSKPTRRQTKKTKITKGKNERRALTKEKAILALEADTKKELGLDTLTPKDLFDGDDDGGDDVDMKIRGGSDDESDDGIMPDDYDTDEDELPKPKLEMNVVGDTEKFILPSGQEVEQEKNAPLDMGHVKSRIEENIAALKNFAEKRADGKSRAEYMSLLRNDVMYYYGYNDYLTERFTELISLDQLIAFFEANEIQRPITIRTNTLKARRRELAQALINRGVNLDPVGKWSKVGLVIYDSAVSVGATPEYLAGHYMVQSASSFLPVMALAPQEGERVLDMCAAPGGKTSYISQLMKNTGMVLANDKNKNRIKALVGNTHRLGCSNVVTCNYDGRSFPTIQGGFDRVLLDAPCSGTGVIAKDPSAKQSKEDKAVRRIVHIQKELLLAAIDSVDARSKTGGYIIYCTCSLLVEENEWVVDYGLKNRNVKLVSTGLDLGEAGFTKYRQWRFHPSLNQTMRYYPHTHNMDGFFVAKFKKVSNDIPEKKAKAGQNDTVGEDDESEDEAATNGKVTDHDSGAEVDAQNAKKKKGLKSKKGQILVRASNKTAPTVPKVSKKKATTTADNTKDSKTEDSKTEDSKTEDSETEKMETMEVDEDVPPTEAVKAEEDSTKPIETDEKVEETEKKPRKPRKVHNAADMKDKFWRDVSKMTEAQKNKYFKSKAIRKFVKLREQGKGKNAGNKKKKT